MSIDSYAKIGSYLMTNNLNLQFLENKWNFSFTRENEAKLNSNFGSSA